MILNRSLNYRTGHKSQQFPHFFLRFSLISRSLFFLLLLILCLLFVCALYVSTANINKHNNIKSSLSLSLSGYCVSYMCKMRFKIKWIWATVYLFVMVMAMRIENAKLNWTITTTVQFMLKHPLSRRVLWSLKIKNGERAFALCTLKTLYQIKMFHVYVVNDIFNQYINKCTM